jgi:hypothetical protein
MWKANIKQVFASDTPSVASVQIDYVNDDGRKETRYERISDPNSIKSIAQNGINELNRIDAITAFLANPPLGALDLTSPILTQEEINQNTLTDQRQILIQAKQDLDLGLIDQATYDNQLSSVVAVKTSLATKAII